MKKVANWSREAIKTEHPLGRSSSWVCDLLPFLSWDVSKVDK